MVAIRSPKKTAEQESTPQVPQSTPYGAGFAPGSHDFTLQAVMELQKSVGELNANMQAMKSALDGVKTKVDDLVGWKNRILGGAAALTLVVAVLSFLFGKASDYFVLKPPSVQPSIATTTPPAIK